MDASVSSSPLTERRKSFIATGSNWTSPRETVLLFVISTQTLVLDLIDCERFVDHHVDQLAGFEWNPFINSPEVRPQHFDLDQCPDHLVIDNHGGDVLSLLVAMGDDEEGRQIVMVELSLGLLGVLLEVLESF